MTLTGALILEEEKILFADTLWQNQAQFNHTKIFSNANQDYLLTSGIVAKTIISEFTEHKYSSIVKLIARNYLNYRTYSSFIYYNNLKDAIFAYFVEQTKLSKIDVKDFILIGYLIGKKNIKKIESKKQLIELLKEHSLQNSEMIGTEYEFKIIKDRKLKESFKMNFKAE
jgi:hypothetical protein